MSDIEESAKAVQEIAKLGASTIENLDKVETVGKKLLGPFGQAYGILTDLATYKREEIRWRLANKLSIYQKASEKAYEQGISFESMSTVPPRLAYQYEDALEREDDDSLQEIWAQLLINVTNPDAQIHPRKIYKDILDRLDPKPALFFQEMASRPNINLYFVVCGMSPSGTLLGHRVIDNNTSENNGELFEFSDDGDDLYCSIEPEEIESLVDELATIGIVRWEKSLFQAEELMAADEQLEPSADNIELATKILANARGLNAFRVSDLGTDFWNAIKG